MSCDGNCQGCNQNGNCATQNQNSGCAPDKCASCPSKGKCGSVAAQNTPENLKIAQNLQKFHRIYLVLSGKGGVGKSTVSTQLAYCLADKHHKKTCLMDIDICGPSVPTMTHTVGNDITTTANGMSPVGVTENLQTISVGFMLGNVDDAVIMRGPKKHGVIQQFLQDTDWDVDTENTENNYLVIDTPPGTSDEHLSVINLINSCCLLIQGDKKPEVWAIIVSTPQEVALADVRKEMNFCEKISLKIKGVIENMSGFVCPCCNKETLIFHPSSGGCAKLCETFKCDFLGRIPLDPILTKAAEDGVSWGSLGSDSIGLKQFYDIVAQLV